MNRLLDFTLRAYPTEGRAELREAMHETYGDETTLRESLRVLTNGLQLKTLQEVTRPRDLLVNSYLMMCCLWISIQAAVQFLDRTLAGSRYWGLAHLAVSALWIMSVRRKDLVALRVFGAAIVGLSVYFRIYGSTPPIWFIPANIASFVLLTFVPRFKYSNLAMCAAALGVASFLNYENWAPPSMGPFGSESNVTLLLLAICSNFFTLVLPVRLIANSEPQPAVRLPLWPVMLGVLWGAGQAFADEGPFDHSMVSNIVSVISIALIVLFVIIAPYRPISLACLCWHFLLMGLSSFVASGPTSPLILYVMGVVAVLVLLTITRRTNRLLLA
jgi:hypothetical protein